MFHFVRIVIVCCKINRQCVHFKRRTENCNQGICKSESKSAVLPTGFASSDGR